MNKKLIVMVALLAVALFALTACATPTPTPAPPPPTQPPVVADGCTEAHRSAETNRSTQTHNGAN